MVKLFVAVGAYRFKIRKVAVEERLARPLFPKPEHFKVHLFGIRQDSIVCFVVAGGIKLTHKYKATRMFF